MQEGNGSAAIQWQWRVYRIDMVAMVLRRLHMPKPKADYNEKVAEERRREEKGGSKEGQEERNVAINLMTYNVNTLKEPKKKRLGIGHIEEACKQCMKRG